MNTGPTDVTVRIHTRDDTALDEKNAAIWAFGFEGQIAFSDGGVLAYTEKSLTSDHSVIVMLQLNQGVLTPTRTADYWREAPIGGNLEASFVLARWFFQSDDDGNLIAAAIMKLLTQAAGSDGILQENELERYCKANYTALLHIVQEAKRDGGNTLEGIGCYQAYLQTDVLSGLTDRGRKLLLQFMGFKKYLLEFSLITERGVNEALIWQDCLTFAALMGIAEQALQDLRKIYPAVDTQMQGAEITYYVAYRYHLVTYAAAKSAEAEAKRAAGGGGSSSTGGGGGFSGGGSGGGTR